ncbi:MAG: hypothetical protein COX62_00625 [Deltaproteobacteria bacterium CG_4_10_14_0_2_um_filter_43_8]|nr:MAG: hypothetical protein COV43_06025 [Deltaproteobacteria bacterium CG11_big_fil_rev_8_21_14_0_20_42_23]PJA22149.1 MAG: hypothetical protein COX62_00625 [Deltaproteobacteria bacterium CG_4_10_14_0_2_um_filter_43_8]PJC65135.1 MAG: hypothetical protein CO021_01410 [Deltaproteobacteria bacterium CG_4_9_14_0_2_um_filter_42_21]
MPLDADRIRVQHMCDALKEVIVFSKEKTLQDLYSDRQLSLALVKEIEIVGEAASKVSLAFRKQHKNIPWDVIIHTRNRLVHGYFDIDYKIVWQTVQYDVPQLLSQLKKLF